ncbi:hypothetical protein ILUMI_03275 [Ignelater luminosus]|uniref:Uncharacterized protein n=1 Tax=Ignelater luminosus TaxID=2038154 RepID=A0A8K0GK32_IGNLU|nr:hypothetical protein ILUMI_03275 [Ignelater luminosus]
MMHDLDGKSVLVTGGANGIGFGCVREILSAGARAATIVDIDEESGELAVKELTKEFEKSKILLVKADVTKKDQFEGTLLGLQYMGKDKGGKGGVIVNISSILGLQEGVVSPVYSATKYFVNGFSRSFGTPYHYDRTGVRIITVCPGFTVTPLSSLLEQSDANFLIPDLRRLFNKKFNNTAKQLAKKVGEDVVTSIQKGETGSIFNRWKVSVAKPIPKVRDAIKEKRGGKLTHDVLFHQDNAPSYKSYVTMAAIYNAGFEILEQPSYSPDLAHDEEVMSAVNEWLADQSKKFFLKGIQALQHRYEKCINLSGDFVER